MLQDVTRCCCELLFPAISHLTHLTFKSDVEVAASHPAPPNIFHPAAGLQNWWIFGAGKEPEPQGNSCPVRHHMHRIWHQSFSHSRKPKATASLYNSAFAPNVHIRHGTHQVEALRVTARRLQYIQRTLQVQAPTTRAFSLAQGAAIREELQATKDACYLETSWVAPFLLFFVEISPTRVQNDSRSMLYLRRLQFPRDQHSVVSRSLSTCLETQHSSHKTRCCSTVAHPCARHQTRLKCLRS